MKLFKEQKGRHRKGGTRKKALSGLYSTRDVWEAKWEFTSTV